MTTEAPPKWIAMKCTCCGTKIMAREYPDRYSIQAHGHFLVIPKIVDSDVA